MKNRRRKAMRKIYRKEIIVPIIIFSIFSTLSYASTRVLNENFDNQAIIQPTIGSITVNQYGRSNLTPPEYNLTQVGVGGTGYTFSSGTIWEAYLQWNYGRAWSSDEIYVSYWLRYPRYVAPSHDVNAKIFYPHWDGLTSYVHYSMFDDHTLYYSAVSKGSTLSAGNYINCPGNTDGNWHHYEFWIKLSTAQSRFWYDGTLKIDHNYSDGVWGNNIDYLTFGSIDGNDIDDFSRQFDSIEVWDGMPGSSLPGLSNCSVHNGTVR